MALFYTDASALVKLVREEPGTAALHSFLAGADLVSSELVLAEVPRAIRRAAARDPALPLEPLIERGGEVLDAVALRPLDRALLAAAGAFSEPTLRALDAIHVAAAVDLSPLDAFVSYDHARAPPHASPVCVPLRRESAANSDQSRQVSVAPTSSGSLGCLARAGPA